MKAEVATPKSYGVSMRARITVILRITPVYQLNALPPFSEGSHKFTFKFFHLCGLTSDLVVVPESVKNPVEYPSGHLVGVVFKMRRADYDLPNVVCLSPKNLSLRSAM